MNKSTIINIGIASDEKNKETSNSKNTYTAPSSTHTSITKPRVLDDRIIQNFRLVWLDSNIDGIDNGDYIDVTRKLRQVVNAVKIFTNVDECIDFMTDIEEEQIFMVISGTFNQVIVPTIHDMAHIHSVYIFYKDEAQHEQ